MKNTIIKFEKEELDEFIVSDYFSKNVNLFEIFDDLSGFTETYKMLDNDKLERVSLELYGTTDYWDVILMLNDRNPLFEVPYDYDKLQIDAEEIINTYRYYIYSQSPLTDEARALELTNDILNINLANNENYRFIHIIKPSKIGEFIKLAKDAGYI